VRDGPSEEDLVILLNYSVLADIDELGNNGAGLEPTLVVQIGNVTDDEVREVIECDRIALIHKPVDVRVMTDQCI
jgi:hypothetical protein